MSLFTYRMNHRSTVAVIPGRTSCGSPISRPADLYVVRRSEAGGLPAHRRADCSRFYSSLGSNISVVITV